MNDKNDEIAYSKLRQILESVEGKYYSLHVRYCIVSYCTNYLTRIIRKGEVYRGQELLDLYEYSLEHDIFTLNDKMSLKRFINIINLSSKLQKYDWARKTVDKWAYKVDSKNAKTIAKFGHATIDFQLNKFESVIETLSQMKTSNFLHRLRVRWLLLIAQYEFYSSNISILKVQVDNFRRFILSNENRINTTTFEGLKASIKVLNMLLNNKDRQQIMDFYKSSKYIFEHIWIRNKIKNPAS